MPGIGNVLPMIDESYDKILASITDGYGIEVNEAEKLMGTMQIKRIPVLDNNKVVGMLTVGNLVNDSKVTSIEVSNTVENICHCGPNAKNNE